MHAPTVCAPRLGDRRGLRSRRGDTTARVSAWRPWAAALAPYAFADLRLPWLGRLVATDASLEGRGVVERPASAAGAPVSLL